MGGRNDGGLGRWLGSGCVLQDTAQHGTRACLPAAGIPGGGGAGPATGGDDGARGVCGRQAGRRAGCLQRQCVCARPPRDDAQQHWLPTCLHVHMLLCVFLGTGTGTVCCWALASHVLARATVCCGARVLALARSDGGAAEQELARTPALSHRCVCSMSAHACTHGTRPWEGYATMEHMRCRCMPMHLPMHVPTPMTRTHTPHTPPGGPPPDGRPCAALAARPS